MEQLNIPDTLYRDGRHYDLIAGSFSSSPKDIPFYLDWAKKAGGPVLEIACGTGRITIPLAKEGINITGLDISDTMLGEAKKKSEVEGVNVEWVKADCRSFNLGKKFKLIFIPFHSIQHLHDLESLESFFKCVKKHLDKSGVFIVNAFNPSLKILTRDTCRRYMVARYMDPDGTGEVLIEENNTYNDAAQLNEVRWYYTIGAQRRRRTDDLVVRCIYPQEFDMLLKYNGFRVTEKLGNFEGKPFSSGDPEQIAVCTV